MAHKSILLINGPNLNLLGTREPTIYGRTTLSSILPTLTSLCTPHAITLSHIQSNHEGVLIDRIHAARGNVDCIVINPGALTHTSVALRDALVGVEIPFVELHVSNVHAREAFRAKSLLSDKAVGVVCGLGVWGYEVGVQWAVRFVEREGKAGERAKL